MTFCFMFRRKHCFSCVLPKILKTNSIFSSSIKTKENCSWCISNCGWPVLSAWWPRKVSIIKTKNSFYGFVRELLSLVCCPRYWSAWPARFRGLRCPFVTFHLLSKLKPATCCCCCCWRSSTLPFLENFLALSTASRENVDIYNIETYRWFFSHKARPVA